MTTEDYITKHEKMVLNPYIDSVGKLTIGIGRNIDDNGISKEEALFMLENDLKNVNDELHSIFDDFSYLPADVQLALTDMMFNLGKPRFLGFKKMIQAIKDKDFKEAARQAKDSKWCEQVEKRCDDNFNLMFNA